MNGVIDQLLKQAMTVVIRAQDLCAECRLSWYVTILALGLIVNFK